MVDFRPDKRGMEKLVKAVGKQIGPPLEKDLAALARKYKGRRPADAERALRQLFRHHKVQGITDREMSGYTDELVAGRKIKVRTP